MKRKLITTLLPSIFLMLGFLALGRNELYSLTEREILPPEISVYKQETMAKYYRNLAINVFDKGYAGESGPELNDRLSVYPENTPLENGRFVVSYDSLINTIKVLLPVGFRHGILRLDTDADSEYSIGVSYDLQNWEFSDHPGYSERLMNIVDLKQENSSNKVVYLKFSPPRNGDLNVFFNEFQYITDLPSDTTDYSGHTLFFPDLDVDYNGQIIDQPGVSYEEYKLKKNSYK